jgi:hypothetical protein
MDHLTNQSGPLILDRFEKFGELDNSYAELDKSGLS